MYNYQNKLKIFSEMIKWSKNYEMSEIRLCYYNYYIWNKFNKIKKWISWRRSPSTRYFWQRSIPSSTRYPKTSKRKYVFETTRILLFTEERSTYSCIQSNRATRDQNSSRFTNCWSKLNQIFSQDNENSYTYSWDRDSTFSQFVHLMRFQILLRGRRTQRTVLPVLTDCFDSSQKTPQKCAVIQCCYHSPDNQNFIFYRNTHIRKLKLFG